MFFFTSRQKFEAEVTKCATTMCERTMEEVQEEIDNGLIQHLAVVRLGIARITRSCEDPKEMEAGIQQIDTAFTLVRQDLKRIAALTGRFYNADRDMPKVSD